MSRSRSARRSRSRDRRDRDRRDRDRRPRDRDRSKSRSRSRDRRKPSRDRSRGKRDRDRDRDRRRRKDRSRSRSRSSSRSRSRSRRRSRSRSRRRSRTPSPRRSRSREAPEPRVPQSERVPPTDLTEYALDEETGWHVYKRTAKWHYQVDIGVFLHVKSNTYYRQIPDTTTFRRLDEEKDPYMKKLREWEKMRKQIKSAEFVKWEEQQSAQKSEEAAAEVEKEEEKDRKLMGRVQKFDDTKGFGFIIPVVDSKENRNETIFVHRKHILGSSSQNPIHLKEGSKVSYKIGQQDGRPCALEVAMVDNQGKPLAVHTDGRTLDEKRKSLYVSADSMRLRQHVESWPGLKKTLQDRHTISEALGELGVFYGVYDGHGGAQVAEYCIKALPKHVMNQYRTLKVQPASRDEKLRLAMREAFLQVDKEVLESSERKKIEQVGTSAITAVVHGNPKMQAQMRLIISNVGSTRAVLCRAGEAVALSEDHKPQRTDEKKRVERAGGLVLQVRGAWRVCVSANPHSMNKAQRREYQGLEVTRSLGDFYFKQPSALSVPEPETIVVPLSEKDLFVVLATDGVWGVLSSQEVIDIAASSFDDAEEAAKKIVRQAHQKGSEDNLTAMVIQFAWADKNAAELIQKFKQVGSAQVMSTSPKQGKMSDMDMFGGAPVEKATDELDMFG